MNANNSHLLVYRILLQFFCVYHFVLVGACFYLFMQLCWCCYFEICVLMYNSSNCWMLDQELGSIYIAFYPLNCFLQLYNNTVCVFHDSKQIIFPSVYCKIQTVSIWLFNKKLYPISNFRYSFHMYNFCIWKYSVYIIYLPFLSLYKLAYTVHMLYKHINTDAHTQMQNLFFY